MERILLSAFYCTFKSGDAVRGRMRLATKIKAVVSPGAQVYCREIWFSHILQAFQGKLSRDLCACGGGSGPPPNRAFVTETTYKFDTSRPVSRLPAGVPCLGNCGNARFATRGTTAHVWSITSFIENGFKM
jgi:hypothetical protein